MTGITRWKSVNDTIDRAGKNPFVIGLMSGLGALAAPVLVSNPIGVLKVVAFTASLFPEYSLFIAPTDEQRKEAMEDNKIPGIAIDRMVKVIDHAEKGKELFPDDTKKIEKLAYNTLLENNIEWCAKDAINCQKYNKIINKMYGK